MSLLYPDAVVTSQRRIAWGAKVTPAFKARVIDIALVLQCEPDWLMACMAFESAETFSPGIRNAAGSGAVGLIQFMPSTAAALGTSVEELAACTATEQLEYVERYFAHYRGRLHNLADVYMTILWPVAVGKPDYFTLFRQDDAVHPKQYMQNKGLDFNADGVVTKSEAAYQVSKKLERGLLPEFVG